MTTAVALADGHGRTLLDVAAGVIRDRLTRRSACIPDPADFAGAVTEPAASFVTLERDEQLLGCIGGLVAAEPLVVDVARHALAAAFADPRLPPVTGDDFEQMRITVSVLSASDPIPVATFEDLRSGVRPGVDGVLVEAGPHRATLLPSVWDHVAGADEFLAVLWHKAGLAPGVWPPDLVVSRYATEEFGDPGPRSLVVAASP